MSDAVGVGKTQRRMPLWLDRMLSSAVVPDDTLETARTKRLLTGVLWASIPLSLLNGWMIATLQGSPAAGLTIASLVLSSAATLLITWRKPTTYPTIAHLPIGHAIFTSAALAFMAGGLLPSAVNAVWGFVSLLGALAVFNDRRANVWLWVFILSMILASILGAQIEPIYEIENAEGQAVLNLIIVGTFVYFMMYYYVRQRVVLLEESERLLRNTLPEEIAKRLRASDEKIADEFAETSILFADVVDFTPLSAGMKPSELVGLLDEVFSEIDALVEERSLEKIKTIGDAYMVAAGVPHPRPDHAHVLCELALEIQDLCHERKFGGHRITFRIGVNSGPVVAGIIGTRKFAYDLWGDAVNTASRMESSGTAGGIQITNATRALVEEEFVCEPRGVIDVKGKGSMEVWALAGRR